MSQSSLAPLVSVILATDEPSAAVVHAVQSVLAQTYSRYEILLWERRSESGENSAGEWQSLSDTIHYHSQPGMGLAAARNAAIRHSRGDLIALLDADHVWTTDKLCQCVDYLTTHPECDIVYSSVARLDAAGRIQSQTSAAGKAGWILADLFDAPLITDSTAVFRRQVWERFGGFDERLTYSVGHNFWLRVSVGHRIGWIDAPLAIQSVSRPAPDLATQAQECREHAEMLHRYYTYQEGKQRLDRPRAYRTMGRLCLQAGRLAQQLGDWSIASRMYFGAVYYGGTLRARLLFLYANWQRQRRNLPFPPESRDAA